MNQELSNKSSELCNESLNILSSLSISSLKIIFKSFF